MNDTERFLLDIANRMPTAGDLAPHMAQLRELQSTLNGCAYGIWLMVVMVGIWLLRHW